MKAPRLTRAEHAWVCARRALTVRFEGVELDAQGAVYSSGTLVLEDGEGHIERHGVHYSEALRCRDGERVEKGAPLYSRSSSGAMIVAEVAPGHSFRVEYQGLSAGDALREEIDLITGFARPVVSENAERPGLRLVPWDDPSLPVIHIALVAGARLHCYDHQTVERGALLATNPMRDHVDCNGAGGPRLDDLLAGRRMSAHKALLTPVSAQVESLGWSQITVNAGGERVTLQLPSRQHRFSVQEGDWVYAGDALTHGERDHAELAKILGPLAFGEHLAQEIYDVFANRGVAPRRNQIELLVRQLLNRAEIMEVGDSPYLRGEVVDRRAVLAVNEALCAKGLRPAVFEVRFTSLGAASR